MELSSFPILELLQCLLHRQGGPVRAEAGHRVERVGHPHDPHFERDLFALQSVGEPFAVEPLVMRDRKSTRLNSSHLVISYAVFCLKKKKKMKKNNYSYT